MSKSNSTRKRTSKACDICSKRKIKCDGMNPCAPCKDYNRDCTYLAPAKRRGPLHSPLGKPPVPRVKEALVIPTQLAWDHESLLNQQLLDSSAENTPWLENYYKVAYPRISIIPQEFISNHFFDIPLYLLHAMISCCFTGIEAVNPNLILHHLESLKLLQDYMDVPDIFTVTALCHISHYFLRTGSMSKCVAYFALAVRHSHLLRLERDIAPSIIVLSQAGIAINVNDIIVGSSLHLYQYDYYLSVAAEIPFLMHTDIPEYLNNIYAENSLHLYHIGSPLYISLHLLPLVQISRMMFDIKKQPALRQKLLVQLMLWKNVLPSHTEMVATTQHFATEMDSWVAYLLMFYHNIKLGLLLPGLLDNILNPQHDSVKEKCQESCRQITTLTRGFLQSPESLEFMPIYIAQCLFYGGVFNCFISFIYSDYECLASLSGYVGALERYGKVYPAECGPAILLLQGMAVDPQQSVTHLNTLRSQLYC